MRQMSGTWKRNYEKSLNCLLSIWCMVELTFPREYRGPTDTYRSALEKAAKSAHCNPQVSGFHVRAATILEIEEYDEVDGEDTSFFDHVFGGNTEYRDPRAIHGETSLVNHVINKY